MRAMIVAVIMLSLMMSSSRVDNANAQSGPCSLPVVLSSFEAAALSDDIDQWLDRYIESECDDRVKSSVQVMAQSYRIYIGDETGPQIIPGTIFDCVSINDLDSKTNVFQTNTLLPVSWAVQRGDSYWQAYVRIQDEKTVEMTIRDAGDDAGNGALDRVRIYDPNGVLVIDRANLRGNPKFDLNLTVPGYYCILFEDNDTNGNGGDMDIGGIKDRILYLNTVSD